MLNILIELELLANPQHALTVEEFETTIEKIEELLTIQSV